MPITAIDPAVALIIVDLQKGIVGLPLADPIEEVVARSRALADAFRARRLPVVLVNVVGGAPGRTEVPSRVPDALPDDFADIVPELGRRPDDILVTKRSWGAFASTDLDRRLKARGVTQVVVAGVATATGVEATARQAYEAGYNVTLAIDAMTDRRTEAQDYSIRAVFPRLGETGSTDDIIALLEGRG
jgi:nicotinamidase-related amidase